ncbi:MULTISPECIES: TonB-dependent receptor [unclassified Novosphingobium]|uniref:TonB-dependent receptor domain-containing protein n=1 Tax=unclassified Novosphingobium TaxID=2644732 RepID=UPI0025DA57B4|nr:MULTISPECIES: TonB-dependent receptor [unclassified Novosphingobium]HQV02981.1 TonB-dependent receptor [Novosphingobium sp.]
MRSLTTLSLLLAASPAMAQETAEAPASGSAAVDAADETQPIDAIRASGDEILVVATKFYGQIEAPQAPIATFDEADIQALGATNVGELLARVSPQTGSGRGRGGGGQPLVLVNGQRITNFREMRNYPPEAIKRVEILPEEVALRFGSPPNTRVVNLILKDKFDSRRIEAGVSLPTRGGFSSWNGEASLLTLRKLNRFTLTGSVSDTTPLFEAERDLDQGQPSQPTVSTDPDQAEFRTLIADSRSFGLNTAWTKGLGKDGMGGNFTLSGEANRTDSRSYSGFNTVLLTGPLPASQSVLRTLPDPLERTTRATTIALGTGYNTNLGKWQFSATLDGTHAESRTLIDRRATTTSLTDAALAGTLPLTGPLPALTPAGQDLALNNSERIESLVTVSGRPFRVPGGMVSTTFKAGITWIDFDSLDQRSTAGPVSLNRLRVQGGLNVAVPLTSRRENFGRGLGDISLNFSANLSDVSDFGAVNDWSTGLTWAPTEKLNLQASYIFNQEAPSISQLGNPETQIFNVPVYDFALNENVLVTIISGGNPLLKREVQRDIKLSANWTLPIKDSNLLVEWFRNRSSDVTASFPLLTPEIEAAFPGRVVRDPATNRLVSIDQRPVTFARQESSRLRWGFNTSGTIGKAPEGGGGMFGGMGGGGPRGQRPAAAGATPAAAPPAAPRPPAGGGARPGGGRGGGGFMAAMGAGGQGRWSLGVYHTVQFDNTVQIAPGGPVLDLLGGDALSTSGTPRHALEFNGGVFHKGMGMFFQGTWNGPTTIKSSGLPGSTDLRFGSVNSVNLFLFAEFAMMPGVTKKVPFLKGANLSLRIENLFDSVQKVTDGSGTVPLSYQRDFLNPRGRVIGIQFRKGF